MSERMDPVFSNTDKAGAAAGCAGCAMLFTAAKNVLGCVGLIIVLGFCAMVFYTIGGG